MASIRKGKLPNLKICVDNTKEIDSNDDISDEEDVEIKREEKSISSDSSSSSGSENDSSDNEKSDTESVEFNVRISGLTKGDKHSKLPELTKRYENKAGNFVTGLDLTSKEAQEKKEERAKRFGLPADETKGVVDRTALLASLGLKQEDVDKGERGVRLDAIHMRGTDNMSTQDIFKYFAEFGPGRIEWIDDSSCNVVWFDPMTVTRAILALSKDEDTVMAENKKEEDAKMSDTKEDSEDIKKVEAEVEKKTEPAEEENMEVDDELDLNADNNNGSSSIPSKPEADAKPPEKEKTESDEIMDEKTKKDSDASDNEDKEEDEEEDDKKEADKPRIKWPPGKWRLGQPHQKAKTIFLRYATKADKKVIGAENKSKYYVKHGNPNYGGQVGLISGSRKRKYRAVQRNTEYETVKKSISSSKLDSEEEELEEGELDDMVDNEISDEEPIEKPKELFTGKNKSRESRGLEEGEKDEDSLDMEAELQELLGPPVKKRSMRMYADDIEESKKKPRPRVATGGLTIVADTRHQSKSIESRLGREVAEVRDARHRISDARERLSGSKSRHRDRDSYSPRDRDSYSPRDRDSQPRDRDSYSPRDRDSYSPRDRDSYSPRDRDSYSPHSSTDLRSKLKNRKPSSTDNLPGIKIEIFD